MSVSTDPNTAAERARQRGERLPNFQLPGLDGMPSRLSDVLQSGPAVLVFIRGNWCPFCDAQLSELYARVGEFATLGATIVVVTPEVARYAERPDARSVVKVWLDPEQLVAQQMGLTYRVDAALRDALVKELEIELPARTGIPRWELPVPSTFVVGSDFVISAAWSSADPAIRPSVDDILETLRG